MKYEDDFLILLDRLKKHIDYTAKYYANKLKKIGSPLYDWEDLRSEIWGHLWVMYDRKYLRTDAGYIKSFKNYIIDLLRMEQTHQFYNREYRRTKLHNKEMYGTDK